MEDIIEEIKSIKDMYEAILYDRINCCRKCWLEGERFNLDISQIYEVYLLCKLCGNKWMIDVDPSTNVIRYNKIK